MALFDPPALSEGEQLQDGFGRRFTYLRLSLTERCNFRCTYCLPNGFQKQPGLPEELSRDEIRRAVQAFSRLGLWKLRLTGGEPTVRTDFTDIARELAGIEGIRRVAMTTNGYRLARSATDWLAAGITAVNVSIDTLDNARFAQLTGKDLLHDVVGGVDTALSAGFKQVKINSVLMRDLDGCGWREVLEFVRHRDVAWRFIELMRTTGNVQFHERQATPGAKVRERLVEAGWYALASREGAGPAVEYAHPDYCGRIGLIAPYEHGFCDSCNRLRLSSRGQLHLCLFGKDGLNLRDLLQDDAQQDELVARIVQSMPGKARGHRLNEGDSGATPHLASIGG